MTIKATSPDDYITKVPEERAEPMTRLRQTIVDNLPDGFEECMSYGMIGYVVPLSRYPDGYHCKADTPLPFINLASQKNYIALYHSGIYADPELLAWFTSEYPKHAKRKLDMGKSCIRFKKMDDIPYELISQLVQRVSVEEWIATYEKAIKK